MKREVLIAILFFNAANVSTAEGAEPTIVGSGKCGEHCTYTLDSAGTFTISGYGAMEDYNYTYGIGWHDTEGNPAPGEKYGTAIKSVVFAEGSNITRIGDGVFKAARQLTHIEIPDSVTRIGRYSFQNTGLTDIIIPESVTYIGDSAFWNADSLTSVTIPESAVLSSQPFREISLAELIISDSANTSNWSRYSFENFPEGTNIYCQGDMVQCQEKLARFLPESLGGTCTQYCLSKAILPAGSEQCSGSYIYENESCHKRNENQCNATKNYYYNGATCVYRPSNGKVNCVNASYKENDGYCDRIHYTPAEAAAVLHDDNTNSVTITFKK